MLDETGLWRDVTELPSSLQATLDGIDGVDEVAALLRAEGVRRVVASGNGAAYYVTMALWLASLESAGGPEILAVPSGLLASGRFRWREGDRFLAVSSSGEFRDLVEATEDVAIGPFAAVTANADSTIGSRAAVRALVSVPNQRAVTHSQAFCGAVVASLAVWATVTSDEGLQRSLHALPDALESVIADARAWVDDVGEITASTAVAFGSGPGWAAALEAALVLKEVSGIPAEGVETREGATSAMMALEPGALALSLPVGPDDSLLDEAEAICAAQGATVLRAPGGSVSDRRLAAVTTFPAMAALGACLGIARGRDVDQPPWLDAYYKVARKA